MLLNVSGVGEMAQKTTKNLFMFVFGAVLDHSPSLAQAHDSLWPCNTFSMKSIVC